MGCSFGSACYEATDTVGELACLACRAGVNLVTGADGIYHVSRMAGVLAVVAVLEHRTANLAAKRRRNASLPESGRFQSTMAAVASGIRDRKIVGDGALKLECGAAVPLQWRRAR